MKKLADYITEAEAYITGPVVGDDIGIEIDNDQLVESYVIEITEDGIVIDANEQVMHALEINGLLAEEIRRYGAVGSSPGMGHTLAEQEPVDEGRMKDIDIERQDYERMDPLTFRKNYGIDKDTWYEKNRSVLEPKDKKPQGWDIGRMMELAGVSDHKYNKQDDLYQEDQSADVVAKKEFDMDAALDLGMKESEHDMDESALQAYLGRKKYGEEGMKALQQAGREGASKETMARIRAQHDKMAEAEMDEAKYQGREVALGKPMQGDVKKFKVYVRDPKTGNVKKVNFGDKTMRIKKSNPARRRSFRARHNCDNPGPRTKARYWSCRKW